MEVEMVVGIDKSLQKENVVKPNEELALKMGHLYLS